jgi:hypothetical protein
MRCAWRRFVVADHLMDDLYVVAAVERSNDTSRSAADSWLDATAAQISALAAAARLADTSNSRAQHQQKANRRPAGVDHAAAANGVRHSDLNAGAARHCNGGHAADLQPRHTKQQYLHNLQECLQVAHDDSALPCLSVAAHRCATEVVRVA